MKPVNFDLNDVVSALSSKIALLEQQLATEFVQKKAIVQYAESLEQEIEKLKGNSISAVGANKSNNAK